MRYFTVTYMFGAESRRRYQNTAKWFWERGHKIRKTEHNYFGWTLTVIIPATDVEGIINRCRAFTGCEPFDIRWAGDKIN